MNQANNPPMTNNKKKKKQRRVIQEHTITSAQQAIHCSLDSQTHETPEINSNSSNDLGVITNFLPGVKNLNLFYDANSWFCKKLGLDADCLCAYHPVAQEIGTGNRVQTKLFSVDVSIYEFSLVDGCGSVIGLFCGGRIFYYDVETTSVEVINYGIPGKRAPKCNFKWKENVVVNKPLPSKAIKKMYSMIAYICYIWNSSVKDCQDSREFVAHLLAGLNSIPVLNRYTNKQLLETELVIPMAYLMEFVITKVTK